MSPVTRDNPPRAARETMAAVSFIAGTDPESIQGYAVIVDDGTPEATVTTNLGELPLLVLLVEVLRLLARETTL